MFYLGSSQSSFTGTVPSQTVSATPPEVCDTYTTITSTTTTTTTTAATTTPAPTTLPQTTASTSSLASSTTTTATPSSTQSPSSTTSTYTTTSSITQSPSAATSSTTQSPSVTTSTTTATASPTIAATSATSTTTTSSCLCKCSDIGKLIRNNAEAWANLTTAEKVQAITERLRVEKTQLTSTVRKKTSAQDNRAASQSVGYVAMAFVTVIFGSIVVIDALTLLRYIRKKISKIMEVHNCVDVRFTKDKCK